VVDVLLEATPVTSLNFLQYVEDGFYDGTIFHRVVPDFVVQGGGFLPGPDMLEPDGLRDPIVNEFSPDRSNVRGTVAMAKVGGDPDSATSQFFFNLADNSANLDNQNGGFTVFATVAEGQDVVDAMAEVELDGESPVDDIVISMAKIE
jgi:peptidyl-prolyl cis-trans isomerase A (cyclophilin A)